MMICPETFYEENLKGKTESEIIKVIRILKRKITKLKNIAEHPDYKCSIRPSEATQISCNREYLERAKEALAELGDKYEPSRSEIKATEFETNIPFIKKIVFDIGGYFDGYTKTTITIGEKIHKYVEHSLEPQPLPVADYDENSSMTREEFLFEFSEIHIGEWRRKYDLHRFGYEVMDGTQWSLEIYYSNESKPVRIYGDNAYPYNFNRLKDLIDDL